MVLWSRLFPCFSTPGPSALVVIEVIHVGSNEDQTRYRTIPGRVLSIMCSIFLCTMRKQNALCLQYDNIKECHFINVSANHILRHAVDFQTILLLKNGPRDERSWEYLYYIKSLCILPLLDTKMYVDRNTEIYMDIMWLWLVEKVCCSLSA